MILEQVENGRNTYLFHILTRAGLKLDAKSAVLPTVPDRPPWSSCRSVAAKRKSPAGRVALTQSLAEPGHHVASERS